MTNLTQRLTEEAEAALDRGDKTLAASLAQAAAALRSAEAQERQAAIIEKTLAAFAEAGEALKAAAGHIDPAEMARMMEAAKREERDVK